jgi:hypothetical protein
MHPLVSQLIHDTELPCVSIYLPVLPGLTHATENIERLNRLLDDIEGKLQPYGISGKAQSQFVASARAYADSDLASGLSAEGTLAVFLSPSSFYADVLPIHSDERTTIGPRFSITPVLPFLYSSMQYYILAVSKNNAHFLEVKNGDINACDISGMPKNQGEAWEGMERQTEEFQSNTSDDSETETKIYVQKIAKSLHTLLHEHHLPLVFTGVEELYGMYKHFDTSGRLLENYIKGSPEHMDGKMLMEHADPIVKESVEKRNAELLEAYGNVAGTGRTSTDLNDILDAAAAGKVDMLFVAEGAEQWGTFNVESGKKELAEASDGSNEELLGLAASHTLKHKGQVVSLSADKMPEGKQIAALLRF